MSLQVAVKIWPTPTTRDWKDGTAEACQNVPINALLGRAVHGGQQTRQMWATPRTITGGPESAERKQELGRTESGGGDLQSQAGGALNPDWVEWLMGWPIGHTALEPLATDRFRAWLSAHGKPCEALND